jgi:hypothetical protein
MQGVNKWFLEERDSNGLEGQRGQWCHLGVCFIDRLMALQVDPLCFISLLCSYWVPHKLDSISWFWAREHLSSRSQFIYFLLIVVVAAAARWDSIATLLGQKARWYMFILSLTHAIYSPLCRIHRRHLIACLVTSEIHQDRIMGLINTDSRHDGSLWWTCGLF